MAVEIERKFLLKNDDWKKDKQGNLIEGVAFRQGYIPTHESTVRVRIEGTRAKLTIKGKTVGMSRLEYEYEIPFEDANEMLDALCQKPLIEKTRYFKKADEVTWEIDIFEGDNAGLRVAEVELLSEDQQVDYPDWLGEEVTGDAKYYNSNLVAYPFTQWDQS
ncbi:adenylate cyclase [Gammaproteobacteria bacterium 45_16_T64]|nr:adenylate cyclase [Gammaproteobacteria bacterium 45_16_T64]